LSRNRVGTCRHTDKQDMTMLIVVFPQFYESAYNDFRKLIKNMIICNLKHCSLISNYQCSNNPKLPNEFQKNIFVNYKNSFGSTKPSCIALFLQSNAL